MGETSPKLNFSILPADSEVEVSAQKLLFIGQKTSGGTATAGTLIQDIPNDHSSDTLFGAKSILANMIRKARQLCTDCGYQVQIDAIALDDADSSVASSATIAFTGTATASGELNIVVGSKYYHNYTLSIASGKTASEIATAFNRFYHNCPILNVEDPKVKETRIRLTEAANIVLGSAFSLICLKKTEKV